MHVGLVTRSQIDYALDLANELHQIGAGVSLYLDEKQTGEEVGSFDRPVERLVEKGVLPTGSQVRLLKPPRMRDPRSYSFFRQLAASVLGDDVDILHILLNPGEIWYAALASFVTRIPVVTTMIVPVANVGESMPGLAIWAINKIAALGSDVVVVNGADQVDLVSRRYAVQSDRIVHVPLSIYSRSVKWGRDQIPEEPYTVLFFGRAHPQKGLEYLIRAQPLISKQLPQVRILISAHGPWLKGYREMITVPEAYEITEGIVGGDTMASLFQRASLVALPYISASTSGVLVTAYSFGKPVVASDVGCLSEYVENEQTGVLVPPADIEALADAIVGLLKDDNLRRQMGINAETRAKEIQQASIRQSRLAYERARLLHCNR